MYTRGKLTDFSGVELVVFLLPTERKHLCKFWGKSPTGSPGLSRDLPLSVGPTSHYFTTRLGSRTPPPLPYLVNDSMKNWQSFRFDRKGDFGVGLGGAHKSACFNILCVYFENMKGVECLMTRNLSLSNAWWSVCWLCLSMNNAPPLTLPILPH